VISRCAAQLSTTCSWPSLMPRQKDRLAGKMNSSTTIDRLDAPQVISPNVLTHLKWAMQDTVTITWRDMVRTVRQPEMLMFAVIMGVVFLLLFNYVFGGVIGAGAGVNYIQYVVPGVLVITALNGAQQTGTGLASDLSEGVTNRFMSLPMSQVAVIAGRTIADSIRNILGLLLVVLIGVLMGFRFESFSSAVLTVLLPVGIGYAFSWLGAALAARLRNPETLGMLSMFWLFPLMLASSAFAPTESMPRWLQGFAEYQPISTATNAARAWSDGSPARTDSLLTLAWVAGILAVCVPLSMHLYRKST